MSTVRITYFDKAAVRRAVDEYVRDLVQRRPEVEEVVLFGSMVRGTPVPGSDVDLLIAVGQSDRAFPDRIPLYLPADLPVDADVFVYTRAEIAQARRAGNAFIAEALRDGVPLFRRSPSG